MWSDVRYALRLLAKNRGFSIIAILTLALGIGANTSIFTVANAVLLRPLAYSDPDRLVLVSMSNPELGTTTGPLSFPCYTFLHDHSRSFSGMAAFTNESFNLTQGTEPQQLPAARVSADFFRVLGVRPMLGRDFAPEEDKPGSKPVVVIGHSLWMRRFAGSRNILGQTIDLNTQRYTIIGIAPAGFQFAPLGGAAVDIWAPRVFDLNLATPQQIQAGAQFLDAVARLKPGVSIEQARAETNVINRQYQRELATMADTNPKFTVSVRELREQLVANVRPAVLILFGAVGLVLLIACANVASLLLSRAVGRKKEVAVRMALGATRADLIRQLLTESLLLAMIGGALGVLLSSWTTHALASLAQRNLPRFEDIRIDGVVLAFATGISLVTGILFGLVPALQTSGGDLNAGLRDESRGSTSGRVHNRLRATLVIGQVALSVTLLIGSGLLIRSFVHLLNVSPGVDASNVLTMSISLPPSRYTANPRMVSFFNEVIEQAKNIPGVRSAAGSSALPVSPSRFSPALLEGQPAIPLAQRPVMVLEMISPSYFETMRTPLLAGRMFTEHDDAQAPLVAIVNQTLAHRYWPNERAVGKNIYLGRLTVPMQVVGVTADIKNVKLAGAASPEIYMPFAQRPWRTINLILRTTGDPRTLIATARHLVASVDKDQPVTDVRTLEEVLAASRTQPRLMMLLLGVFSGVALVLALVGIYGTLSYLVAQRTQEMGIRIALGAGSNDILAMVMRQGMTITLAGVAIGLALSLVATRLLSSLLYQVSKTDPVTFVGVVVVFALVALLASYIPARRATRVDPTMAMR